MRNSPGPWPLFLAGSPGPGPPGTAPRALPSALGADHRLFCPLHEETSAASGVFTACVPCFPLYTGLPGPASLSHSTCVWGPVPTTPTLACCSAVTKGQTFQLHISSREMSCHHPDPIAAPKVCPPEERLMGSSDLLKPSGDLNRGPLGILPSVWACSYLYSQSVTEKECHTEAGLCCRLYSFRHNYEHGRSSLSTVDTS